MKINETIKSDFCGGYRHCYKDDKIYQSDDEDCKDCVKDAESALLEFEHKSQMIDYEKFKNHTPGDWKQCWESIINTAVEIELKRTNTPLINQKDTVYANACLIASAPELLNICLDLKEQLKINSHLLAQKNDQYMEALTEIERLSKQKNDNNKEQEINFLLAQKTDLKKMIDKLPKECVIDLMSLKSRLEKVEQEISEMNKE